MSRLPSPSPPPPLCGCMGWTACVWCVDCTRCMYVTGEDHFNASQNPYLYFQVLILTAQFEAVSTVTHTYAHAPIMTHTHTYTHTHTQSHSSCSISHSLRLLTSFTVWRDSDHMQSILQLHYGTTTSSTLPSHHGLHSVRNHTHAHCTYVRTYIWSKSTC